MYEHWLKRLFIFSFLFFLPSVLMCQNGTRAILLVAEHFAEDGLHEEAITEYRRALFFGKEKGERSRAYYLMGIEYRELEQWQKAEQAFENALMTVETESLKAEVTMALASAYIVSEKPGLALMSLIPLLQETNNDAVYNQALLLCVIAEVKQHNWKQAILFVDQLAKKNSGTSDSTIVQLRAFLVEAEKQKPLDPEKAKFLSTILPGSGQMYSGDVVNGLHAFALNSINVWVVINNIIQADYVSAVVYAVLVTERYYAGNRYHAEQIAIKANEIMETHLTKTILSVLSKYAGKISLQH